MAICNTKTLMVKKLLGYFMKKNYKRTDSLQVKKKGNKLNVKFVMVIQDDNSFINWIDEKRYPLPRTR